MPLFAFSQIEAPWPLGPPPGRYLVRAPGALPDAPPSHVLHFAILDAPRRARRRRARRPAAPEPAPTAVSTGRATIIAAGAPFPDAAAAARWLAAAGEAELAADLRVLGRALHAYGVLTADLSDAALSRERLLVARVGIGAGEEVADGRWSDARELLPGPAPRRRSVLLEPQARLAGVLGGQAPLLLCEELARRARADLDAQRPRTAALQLRIALDAALVELSGHDALEGRLADLRGRRAGVEAAAELALRTCLDEAPLTTVAETLGRLEAVLRARVAARA